MPVQLLVQICRALNLELGSLVKGLGEVKKMREKKTYFLHIAAATFCLMILYGTANNPCWRKQHWDLCILLANALATDPDLFFFLHIHSLNLIFCLVATW